MVLNPDVQRKAQRELDQVVGPHRLPDFADQPSLPYVDAIVKETLRWNPVVPLGEGPMFFSYTPQRKRTVLKEGPPNTRRPPHAHGGRRVRRVLPPQGHARRRQHLVSPHQLPLLSHATTLTPSPPSGRSSTTQKPTPRPQHTAPTASSVRTAPRTRPCATRPWPRSASGGAYARGGSWPPTRCGSRSRACSACSTSGRRSGRTGGRSRPTGSIIVGFCGEPFSCC